MVSLKGHLEAQIVRSIPKKHKRQKKAKAGLGAEAWAEQVLRPTERVKLAAAAEDGREAVFKLW